MTTLAKIAKKVGVSKTAVSITLNSSPENSRIGAETRKRIEAAARELGYQRNALANSVATGKSHVVAFIAKELGMESNGKVLEGVMNELNKKKYYAKLFCVADEKNASEVAKSCIEQRVMGVVCRSLSPLFLDSLQKELKEAKIPIAVIGGGSPLPWGIHVECDDFSGCYQAVQHLKDLGHHRVGFASMHSSASYATIRHDGFLKACKELDMAVEASVILNKGTIDKLRKELNDYLKKDSSLPSAWVCTNDQTAAVLISCLREQNHLDTSVVGYGDLSIGRYLDPPLTTISEPYHAMGESATRLLLREIEAENPCLFTEVISKSLEVKLIRRQSSIRA